MPKKKRSFACFVLCACFCFVCVACAGRDIDGKDEAAQRQPVIDDVTVTAPLPTPSTEPNEPSEPQESGTTEIPVTPVEPNDSQENPQSPEPQVPATPRPQVKTDTLLSSVTDGLNVRKGAGASYASVGTLDKSDMVMPVRKIGNWYEIYYKNTVGYVAVAYVKEVSFATGTAGVENVIAKGKKLLGIPYELGAQRYHWGNGKRNTNFTGKTYDCSSLMQYIFKIAADVNLGLTTRDQCVQGSYVAKGNIRRGDLLFFTNASRANKTGIERVGHVAMYLGDNIILHTASDHAVIEPVSAQRWAYYITARRFL